MAFSPVTSLQRQSSNTAAPAARPVSASSDIRPATDKTATPADPALVKSRNGSQSNLSITSIDSATLASQQAQFLTPIASSTPAARERRFATDFSVSGAEASEPGSPTPLQRRESASALSTTVRPEDENDDRMSLSGGDLATNASQRLDATGASTRSRAAASTGQTLEQKVLAELTPGKLAAFAASLTTAPDPAAAPRASLNARLAAVQTSTAGRINAITGNTPEDLENKARLRQRQSEIIALKAAVRTQATTPGSPQIVGYFGRSLNADIKLNPDKGGHGSQLQGVIMKDPTTGTLYVQTLASALSLFHRISLNAADTTSLNPGAAPAQPDPNGTAFAELELSSHIEGPESLVVKNSGTVPVLTTLGRVYQVGTDRTIDTEHFLTRRAITATTPEVLEVIPAPTERVAIVWLVSNDTTSTTPENLKTHLEEKLAALTEPNKPRFIYPIIKDANSATLVFVGQKPQDATTLEALFAVPAALNVNVTAILPETAEKLHDEDPADRRTALEDNLVRLEDIRLAGRTSISSAPTMVYNYPD